MNNIKSMGIQKVSLEKVIDPGHIYEVGYPKCVCPDVCSGKQRIKRTVNVPDKAYYIFWSIYYQTKELP